MPNSLDDRVCPCFTQNVTPAAASGTVIPSADEVPTFNFHQDSGMEKDLEYRPAPRFSMKAAYYLTDVLSEGMGNTWLVPAQHLSPHPLVKPVSGIGQPDGAIAVKVKANSCLLFDRRCWHSPTPNWSASTRIACFVGYAYRWLRPKEPMFTEPALANTTCPVTRQLLGDSCTCAGEK